MDSSSEEGNKKEQQEEQFTATDKKQSKKASKSKDKKGGKGKAKGGKKPKQKKENKKEQNEKDKQPKKKKASKSKDKGANFEKDLETVKQYLEKQNRPYNLLNVFDNLHGSIKKPSLEAILDKLTATEVLTCKQFGKNKVYFLNQSRFQINEEEIEKVSVGLTEAREQNGELQARHKALSDQYKKLMSMKKFTQIQEELQKIKNDIKRLEIKKQKLIKGGVESKIDEAVVVKIEKQQEKLRRDLKKYKGLKKDALNTWSEILEKKPIQVAEIMGLDV